MAPSSSIRSSRKGTRRVGRTIAAPATEILAKTPGIGAGYKRHTRRMEKDIDVSFIRAKKIKEFLIKQVLASLADMGMKFEPDFLNDQVTRAALFLTNENCGEMEAHVTYTIDPQYDYGNINLHIEIKHDNIRIVHQFGLGVVDETGMLRNVNCLPSTRGSK